MPTSGGVTATNIDVASIVSQLMTVEKRPLQLMSQKDSVLQAQISAWGKLKGTLATLQTAVKSLASVDSFSATKATLGDPSIATATATAAAATGSHSLEVLALAQQQRLNTGAFAANTDAVGEGTLTFQYGTTSGASFTLNAAKAAQTVTIGAGQGTLAGIRDAVNAANIGVSASIVTDSSGNRLVFTSKDTGAASSLKVTVTDTDGNALDATGLSMLAYDPALTAGAGKNLAQSTAAQDASIRLDGLSISSASNAVTGALEGVTLNLTKTTTGTPTALTIARDTAAVETSIQSFVNAYNAAAATLRSFTGYDASTKQGGLLQGDAVASSIAGRVRSVLSGTVQALSGSFTSLAQIGVTLQKDGGLALDSTKLKNAMNGAFGDIAALFARTGKTTASGISYKSASDASKAGEYAITLSQLAARGSLAGSAAAGLVISAGVNDTLSMTVDGVSANVTLAAGTYADAGALAAELQTRANGAAAFAAAGISVGIAASGGALTATSQRYGAASSIAVDGSAGAVNLFGAAPVAIAGLDVAGTINGVAATGSGKVLTGATGDVSAGIEVRVDAAPLGAAGTVRYSIGYASQIDRLMEEVLQSTGPITSRTDGLAARRKAIDKQVATFNTRLTEVEARYRAQFVALDALLARMNSTSNFLTSQLANLPGSGS